MGCCSAKHTADSPAACGDVSGVQIVIRVINATLTKNFETFGKMDPFAVIRWKDEKGKNLSQTRTRTDWDAHMSPQWNHTCAGHLYAGNGESVEISVFDEDMVGFDSFCGSASMSVLRMFDDLSSARAKASKHRQTTTGRVQDLDIMLNSECTGTVSIQAIMVYVTKASAASTAGETFTQVPDWMFETPVSRFGVSGGTAPFFELRLREPLEAGKSKQYYIGKDLSRATDEIAFYENVLSLRKLSGESDFESLLAFTFEYAGVFTCREAGVSTDAGNLELLVLRNMFDGCTKLRLLDIKIGQKTAAAGWQGKSRMAAFKQALVDGLTNSACEGFRLEGFDGYPAALRSMDPLLDLNISGEKVRKKALRFMFQRMNGAEMFMHFLDVHQEPGEAHKAHLEEFLSPSELAEVVLHEIVCRLVRLALACRRVPCPQKWIGSSVALGFDIGELPRRTTPEAELRKSTVVSIFDWGRSELNTLEKHSKLSPDEQRDRSEYWGYYLGGIDQLAWEALRAYRHSFTNAAQWTHVEFTVFDFDVLTDNDFLGTLRIPLYSCAETTAYLFRQDGSTQEESTITYSIDWRAFPAASRLQGSWRISLLRARNLPNADMGGISDPFCVVTAMADMGTDTVSTLRFRQTSGVQAQTLDPDWHETFEIPIAVKSNAMEEALAGTMTTTTLQYLTPMEGCTDNIAGQAVRQWQALLDSAARHPVSASPSSPSVPPPVPLFTNCDSGSLDTPPGTPRGTAPHISALSQEVLANSGSAAGTEVLARDESGIKGNRHKSNCLQNCLFPSRVF